MSINERIVVWLKLHKITQKLVAERSGLTQKRVSLILNGKGRMTLTEYVKICAALDVPAGTFLEEAD